MDWTQVIAILGANMSMILWATRQARTDFLHFDKKLDQFMFVWKEESKDFHGRLERIDTEFRLRIEKSDAEFKLRMEKLDSEFKNYLMNQKK